jgi:hypothetical protein
MMDFRADSMVSVVTGFVPLPRHPRSAVEYGELGDNLFLPLGRRVAVHVFHESLDDCWLWRLVHAQKFKTTHSAADNPAKNTLAYHCVQHAKFAWLLKAALRDPRPAIFVWLDYGIGRLKGFTAVKIAEFLERLREGDFAVPGCWPAGSFVIDDNFPCWRFCGGLMVVPRPYLAKLFEAVRQDVEEQLHTRHHVSWETNTLARIEHRLPIRWYQADHDLSMLENY